MAPSLVLEKSIGDYKCLLHAQLVFPAHRTALFISNIQYRSASIMKTRRCALGFFAASCVGALEGLVGRLPAMGYNTFNAFAGDYTAASVEKQAEIMQERGLVDAGYRLMLLDDYYALKERNSTGHMVQDLEKFPDGIRSLSDYLEPLGMKLAAYGDNGYATCGGHPGSYGHELQDLATWHSWGMDYLKYDNCCRY